MTVIEEPSDAARTRFLEVDGLKGLAVAAIVAYQIFRFGGFPASAPAAVARVFSDLSQGLDLFLMLAAFLFAYPLLAALKAEGTATLDLGRYLCGRALRIYPAYLVVVALAACLHPLGVLFGYPALAHAAPALDVAGFARNVVFAGGGIGNDGLRAVGLFALAYVLLPFLVTLWTRLPRAALFLAIAASIVDTLTRAHGFGIGLLVPLTFGIVAADLRVRRHRAARFGLPVAAFAAALAFVFEPHIAMLPGALLEPTALRIDPFWSVACFGVLVACGAMARVRLVLGFIAFRWLSAPAYAASLLAMPIAEFAARQMPPQFGSLQAAVVTAAVIGGTGYGLWQSVDRLFARETFRALAAVRPGALVDRVLARARIATVTYAYPPPPPIPDPAAHDGTERRGVEPPPVPQAELARLSTRTGSPEDLAAEIVETKKRLTERAGESTLLPLAAARPEPTPVIPAPVAIETHDSTAIEAEPTIATVVNEPPPQSPLPAEPPTAPISKEPASAGSGAIGGHAAPISTEHAAPISTEHAAPISTLRSRPEFVAASATRALEEQTVATLTALVESVEAERELQPAAPRPAIRMRIGPPRARSDEA